MKGVQYQMVRFLNTQHSDRLSNKKKLQNSGKNDQLNRNFVIQPLKALNPTIKKFTYLRSAVDLFALSLEHICHVLSVRLSQTCHPKFFTNFVKYTGEIETTETGCVPCDLCKPYTKSRYSLIQKNLEQWPIE